MMLSTRPRCTQAGAYLLEALIGILIFGLGVLGIVGLQAASTRSTSDSALRAEAVFAANQLLGEMWADSETTLVGSYSSTLGGQPYTDWANQLQSAQGGAWVQNPTVIFDAVPAPSTTSHYVTIQIFWQSQDGDPVCVNGTVKCHSYTTSGVVGQNG